MIMLSVAILFLVASHVVPSHPAIRGRLMEALGRGAYLAAYSLVSAAALAFVVAAYRHAGPGAMLWSPAPENRYAALAVMPFAVLLLTCRLTQSPSRAGGIYRITSTPGSLGVLLWSLVHLMNVGEARTVALFLGMAAIAVASLLRNAAASGKGDGGAVAAIPFARILSGAGRPVAAGIGLWRVLLALAATGLLLHLHPLVIGVDPLAGIR
jgi:uncharacterized membrane protein